MSFLIALFASPAGACSLAAPATLTLDPLLDDAVAPAPPEIVAVDVTRGRGPRRGSFGTVTVTSCDDLGSIRIGVARPEGDPDTDTTVGYRLDLVDGALPDGLGLPEGEAWLGPDLVLSWIDGARDDQDAFDFSLALTPVDAAGNEGEPVEVDVSDDGIPDVDDGTAGCRTAPVPSGALAAFLLLAVRRRARR